MQRTAEIRVVSAIRGVCLRNMVAYTFDGGDGCSDTSRDVESWEANPAADCSSRSFSLQQLPQRKLRCLRRPIEPSMFKPKQRRRTRQNGPLFSLAQAISPVVRARRAPGQQPS